MGVSFIPRKFTGTKLVLLLHSAGMILTVKKHCSTMPGISASFHHRELICQAWNYD